MAVQRMLLHRKPSLLPIGGAFLCIAAAACGEDGGTPPVGPEQPDTVPAVASIEFVPPQQFLGSLGLTKPILAVALAEDGSLLYGGSDRFSWSSSAPDVVTVDEQGVIASVGWGTATVTATGQGVAGTTPVTVRDAIHVAWSVPIPGGIGAGNVMGPDGTIYVGTNDFATHRTRWYAISRAGGVRWTVDLPLTGGSIPAIGADGTLYVGSWSEDLETGSLIAVDPGGAVRWVLQNIDPIYSSTALGPNGMVHVAGRRHMYAVDPQGEIQWTYQTTKKAFGLSSPAIASDGTIYVGGSDQQLHAINPDGSPRWTFGTGDLIYSSPSIGPDGTIYFGSLDGRLYAVHPDGTERWSVELHCGLPWGCLDVEASPSVGPDGTIYVMVDGVYAVDPGGSIRWHYPGSQTGGTPVLGADGTIYIGNTYPLADGGGKGMIVALDPQGRLLWEHRTEGTGWGSALIGLDGTIIATASDELVAIVENGSTNGGFAGAPWPQVRGDRANSGRAGG